MEPSNYNQYTRYPFVSEGDARFYGSGSSVELMNGVVKSISAYFPSDAEEALYLRGVRKTATHLQFLFGAGTFNITNPNQLVSFMMLQVLHSDPAGMAGFRVWDPESAPPYGQPERAYLHIVLDPARAVQFVDSIPHNNIWMNGMLQVEPDRVVQVSNAAVTSVTLDPVRHGSPSMPVGMSDYKITEGELFFSGGHWNTYLLASNRSDPHRFIINFVTGAGEGNLCCLPSNAEYNILRLLSGVTADSTGNVTITGGPGVLVVPVPEQNKIILKIGNASKEC